MIDQAAPGGPRWRACNYPQLLQRTWDEETFVYNPASNQTHLLNAGALALLQYLHEQAASLDELLRAFLPDADPQTHARFEQQVEQLALIGLICPQQP